MTDLRRLAVPTPVSIYEVLEAFTQLSLEMLGEKPSREGLIIKAAHSAGETGHWKSMYCYNLGNVKAVPTGNRPYCYQPTTELFTPEVAKRYVANAKPREDDPSLPDAVITRKIPATYDENGKLLVAEKWVVRFWATNPVAAFRAFDNLEDGCRDHFEFMAQPRFAKALAAAEAGNAGLYVDELYAQRYFTQNLAPYRKLVIDLYREYSAKLKDWQPDFSESTYSRTPIHQFSLQTLTQQLIDTDFSTHGHDQDNGEEEGLQAEVEGEGGTAPGTGA